MYVLQRRGVARASKKKEKIVAVLIFMTRVNENQYRHKMIKLPLGFSQLPPAIFCWDFKGISVTFSIYSIGILAIDGKILRI